MDVIRFGMHSFKSMLISKWSMWPLTGFLCLVSLSLHSLAAFFDYMKTIFPPALWDLILISGWGFYEIV